MSRKRSKAIALEKNRWRGRLRNYFIVSGLVPFRLADFMCSDKTASTCMRLPTPTANACMRRIQIDPNICRNWFTSIYLNDSPTHWRLVAGIRLQCSELWRRKIQHRHDLVSVYLFGNRNHLTACSLHSNVHLSHPEDVVSFTKRHRFGSEIENRQYKSFVDI